MSALMVRLLAAAAAVWLAGGVWLAVDLMPGPAQLPWTSDCAALREHAARGRGPLDPACRIDLPGTPPKPSALPALGAASLGAIGAIVLLGLAALVRDASMSAARLEELIELQRRR